MGDQAIDLINTGDQAIFQDTYSFVSGFYCITKWDHCSQTKPEGGKIVMLYEMYVYIQLQLTNSFHVIYSVTLLEIKAMCLRLKKYFIRLVFESVELGGELIIPPVHFLVEL